jgi:signal transduction histidine kinase
MSMQELGSPPCADTDYVCVATDSLAKMMSDHQVLEVNNRRLTLAMAAAGHDLRQRLQILLGTVELLTSAREETRAAELSQRAKSLIIGLAGELEQLAFQAQREQDRAAVSPQCFAISNLLGRLKSDWESEAVGKYLLFSVDQRDYLVESDPHLLTVIMNNLVGNAVRHTTEGRVAVTSAVEGQFVILAVSDTGPGISDGDLRRSFTFAAHHGRLNEGMGLGLSIARMSAKLLGHAFEITTGENAGTCVRLSLPLARQPSL